MFLFRRKNSMSAKDFMEIKDDVAVLDVRELGEISKKEKDLFPDFTVIPLSQLESRVEELDKNKKYYIMCRSGNRSSMASRILDRYDIKSVVVRGGIIGVNRQIYKP